MITDADFIASAEISFTSHNWNFVFKNIKCLWLLSKIFFNYTTSSSFDVIVIFRRFVISWSKAAPRPAADLTGPKCHMALERTLSLRKYMEFFSFDCFHARLVICLFVVADCCLCRRQPTKFYVVYTIIEFDRKLWMGRVSERSFFACFFSLFCLAETSAMCDLLLRSTCFILSRYAIALQLNTYRWVTIRNKLTHYYLCDRYAIRFR